MWCANCQEDVATEISADGQTIKCTTCGEPVRQVFAPSLHPETQSARELLAKWAEEQKQSVGQTKPATSGEAKSTGDAPSKEVPTADSPASIPGPKSRPKFRIDGAHTPATPYDQHTPAAKPAAPTPKLASATSASANEPVTAPIQPTSNRAREVAQTNETPERPNRVKKLQAHAAHAAPPEPHFDVAAAAAKAKSRPGRAESFWGQLMAYAGVGILTVGTVLVLWGYFGMIEQFASTGWLLSTAGQMLLLLGIVTLISGGMQQTTHEVSERIEYLGGRMIRIEQSTDQILKGPHFAQMNKESATNERGETESSAA